MAQRPKDDMVGIRYYEGESSKRFEVTKEPYLVNQQSKQEEDLNKEVHNQLYQLE